MGSVRRERTAERSEAVVSVYISQAARPGRRLWSRLPRWLRYAVVALSVLAAAVMSVGVGFASAVALPADPVVAQASVLYYRDGRTVLARVGVNDRTDVPLAKVPVPVRRAVLAAEDRDFYGHVGISLRGVARAAVADLFGGDSQGASTITQPYVRN